MKKFTKAFLTNVLDMDKEEVKVVMKYQRLFPELLKDEEGFCVDSRKLWEQLDRPYTRYADWIKKKVMKVKWQENKDYTRYRKFSKGDVRGYGNKTTEEYYFTIDMAKHVCMMENTERGFLVRSYFILIEKALKGYQDHEKIRHPEKQGYKTMCHHLEQQYMKNHDGKEPNRFLYSNNANMINRALLGKSAKQIKESLDIADTQTRENLSVRTNRAIYELQMVNTSLVIADMDYQARKFIIEKTCQTKYSDLTTQVYKELGITA